MEHAGLRLPNRVFSLFEPDALLPIQYLDLFRRRFPIEPEKRLMWAILEDAVEGYRSHFSGRGKPIGELRELECWIRDRDQRWLYSFDNICEMLGIEPQYLRRGLLEWKEKQLARLATKEALAVPARRRARADENGRFKAAG